MELFKEFTFDAAHRVLPYSGIHGHSFFVEVRMTGDRDAKFGWCVSVTEIEPHVEAVRHELDHKYLNEIEGLSVPSLENLAQWIWGRLEPVVPGLMRVCFRRGAQGSSEGCVYEGDAEGKRTPRQPVTAP